MKRVFLVIGSSCVAATVFAAPAGKDDVAIDLKAPALRDLAAQLAQQSGCTIQVGRTGPSASDKLGDVSVHAPTLWDAFAKVEQDAHLVVQAFGSGWMIDARAVPGGPTPLSWATAWQRHGRFAVAYHARAGGMRFQITSITDSSGTPIEGATLTSSSGVDYMATPATIELAGLADYTVAAVVIDRATDDAKHVFKPVVGSLPKTPGRRCEQTAIDLRLSGLAKTAKTFTLAGHITVNVTQGGTSTTTDVPFTFVNIPAAAPGAP
jgi:hypothetical protein